MRKLGWLSIPVLLVAVQANVAQTPHEPKPDCPLHQQGDHGETSPAASPYAGEETRGIKALSAEQQGQLLDGHGMGLARAAELNHYPGPKHVLELAHELELTPEEIDATREIFEEMALRAKELGREIIAAEAALDERFAGGEIDHTGLARAVREVGRLQAELRLVHLRAHLQMRERMTTARVARYDELRGYAPVAGTGD